jgi:hypothetical protein
MLAPLVGYIITEISLVHMSTLLSDSVFGFTVWITCMLGKLLNFQYGNLKVIQQVKRLVERLWLVVERIHKRHFPVWGN